MTFTMRTPSLASLGALAALLSACAMPQLKLPVPDAPASMASGYAGAAGQETPRLQGTQWLWHQTQTPVNLIRSPGDRAHVLHFVSADSVQVLADCNRGAGPYTVKEKQLGIGPVAVTRKLCAPGSLDNLWLQQLGEVRLAFVQHGRLYLDMLADGGTLELLPMNPVSLTCDDGSALKGGVGKDPQIGSAWLELGGRGRVLEARAAARGSLYEGPGIAWHLKGNEALIDLGERKLRCSVRRG
jgi:heat shock protein HslJ